MARNQFKGLIAVEEQYGWTFTIKQEFSKVVLECEPERDRTGNKTFSELPRKYDRVQDAKAFLTRLIGSGADWKEIE